MKVHKHLMEIKHLQKEQSLHLVRHFQVHKHLVTIQSSRLEQSLLQTKNLLVSNHLLVLKHLALEHNLQLTKTFLVLVQHKLLVQTKHLVKELNSHQDKTCQTVHIRLVLE